MAINSPTQLLTSVTINDLDVDMLRSQTTHLITHLRECTDMAPTHRRSLLGIKSMLLHVLDEADMGVSLSEDDGKKFRKLNHKQVNQIRDLYMCGLTNVVISNRLGVSDNAVSQCVNFKSHRNKPYEPTEFAPPNIDDYAGTDKYPWLENWLPEGDES